MGSYLFDMVLCGVTYVILVYFMVKLMRVKNVRMRDDEDDGEGGVSYTNLPEIDLPPGISLPDGPPGGKVKKEEAEILI